MLLSAVLSKFKFVILEHLVFFLNSQYVNFTSKYEQFLEMNYKSVDYFLRNNWWITTIVIQFVINFYS